MLPTMPKRPRKSPAAVALGKKRWQGKSREERREAARKAAQARWAKRKRQS